jgi:hypothetical protein
MAQGCDTAQRRFLLARGNGQCGADRFRFGTQRKRLAEELHGVGHKKQSAGVLAIEAGANLALATDEYSHPVSGWSVRPDFESLLQVGSGMDANVFPAFPDDTRNRTQATAHPAFTLTDPLAELRGRQQIIQIEAL